MSLINTTVALSGSVITGDVTTAPSMPITINSITPNPILLVPPGSITAQPGTLIHKSEPNDQDFVWLWVSNNIFVPYTKTICIQLLRGTPAIGYKKDALLTVPLNTRTLVDNGILITGGVELRAYLVPEVTTAPAGAFAIVNGYVHRRSTV